MAFDPRQEDYQRLGLRFARTLEGDAAQAARAFTTFGRRFAQNRDSLPQSDADRAFHLVAEATALIDYQLPFAADEACDGIIDRAHAMLDEALDLDPNCHDARRMKAAATCAGFEAYYQFLEDGKDDVARQCLEARDEALGVSDDERGELAANIALRPYVRWLATLAARSLICGRYRHTLEVVRKALEIDPGDGADVRFTAALALAKLEDEAGLDALARSRRPASRRGPAEDAWMQLARIALAYKRHRMDEAEQHLATLIKTYPQAKLTLMRQDELPEGVFCRLAVAPFGEDELILAVSEGTVLLQEGFDPQERGSLGSWVRRQVGQQGIYGVQASGRA